MLGPIEYFYPCFWREGCEDWVYLEEEEKIQMDEHCSKND